MLNWYMDFPGHICMFSYAVCKVSPCAKLHAILHKRCAKLSQILCKVSSLTLKVIFINNLPSKTKNPLGSSFQNPLGFRKKNHGRLTQGSVCGPSAAGGEPDDF